jgi:hypothetical protein
MSIHFNIRFQHLMRMSCNAPIFVLYLEMAQEVLEDEVPHVFQMAFEELLSQEGATNSVATDAFGMADSILGETSVPFCGYHLTKDMVIAELGNLEHYEKVQRVRIQRIHLFNTL